MNQFQKHLRDLLDRTDTFFEATYIGRACYARLTDDLRIKAEFTSTLVSEHYNAIRLSAISSRNGVLDTLTLNFSDFMGPDIRIPINNTVPHIWTYNGKTEWYGTPKPSELTSLAEAIDDYVYQYEHEPSLQEDFSQEMG